MEPLKAFICFFCEERFGHMQCLRNHQDTCSLRFSGLRNLFGDVSLPHHPEHIVLDQSQSEKRSFLDYFNVISVARAEARRRNCEEKVVCDAIVVDDSDEDDSEMELESPAESPHKLNTRGVVVKRCNNTISTSHSAQKLLRIDVSSPLGQRLRDHIDSLISIKRETSESERKRPLSSNSLILNNVVRCPSSPFVRDSKFLNKLRRHSSKYRVTFRPSRQSMYSHAYKFTSRQRKEFCRAYDSGLNLQAWRLLRRMKPCRIELFLPPTSTTTYCSSLPESSCQNKLILRIQKSDYPSAEGTMVDCNSCSVSRSVVSDISSTEGSTCETHTSQDVSSTVDAVDSLSSDASEKSVMVAVSTDACDVVSNLSSDSSKDSGVCMATERQSYSDIPAATAEPSVVELDPTSSVNYVKIDGHVETANQYCQTTDSGTDWCSSMAVLPNTVDTSGWSMTAYLPALSFFCNVCANLIDCEVDAKSLIFDHYAGHGITNIDLVEDTFPSGERVMKLMELPAVTTKISTKNTTSQATSPSTSDGELRSSTCNSIMVQPSSSQTANVGSARMQKKQRRVTWADQVCNVITPQHTPSPPCFSAANQDATDIALFGQSSTTSQRTHNGDLASTLCDNNNVNIPSPPVALKTPCYVADTNLPPVIVDESASYSVPVPTRPETNTIRYPQAAAQTVRERTRMFWSKSSLGTPNHYGDMSTQLSTALHLQSSLGGAWHDTTEYVICLD